MEYDRFLNFIL